MPIIICTQCRLEITKIGGDTAKTIAGCCKKCLARQVWADELCSGQDLGGNNISAPTYPQTEPLSDQILHNGENPGPS